MKSSTHRYSASLFSKDLCVVIDSFSFSLRLSFDVASAFHLLVTTNSSVAIDIDRLVLYICPIQYTSYNGCLLTTARRCLP